MTTKDKYDVLRQWSCEHDLIDENQFCSWCGEIHTKYHTTKHKPWVKPTQSSQPLQNTPTAAVIEKDWELKWEEPKNIANIQEFFWYKPIKEMFEQVAKDRCIKLHVKLSATKGNSSAYTHQKKGYWKIAIGIRDMQRCFDYGYTEYVPLRHYVAGLKNDGVSGCLMVVLHELTHILDFRDNRIVEIYEERRKEYFAKRRSYRGDWHGLRFGKIYRVLLDKYFPKERSK